MTSFQEYQQLLDQQPNFMAAWEARLSANLHPEQRAKLARKIELVDSTPENLRFDPDDHDLARVKWSFRKGAKYPYAVSVIRYKGAQHTVFAHRIIALRMHGGELTRLHHVDHINHDTMDNRRPNLRLVDASGNGHNRLRSTSESGLFGVSKIYGKWAARIQVSGRQIPLGSFNSPLAAALAYDSAAREHGVLTRNFPTDF